MFFKLSKHKLKKCQNKVEKTSRKTKCVCEYFPKISPIYSPRFCFKFRKNWFDFDQLFLMTVLINVYYFQSSLLSLRRANDF